MSEVIHYEQAGKISIEASFSDCSVFEILLIARNAIKLFSEYKEMKLKKPSVEKVLLSPSDAKCKK